MIYFMLKIAIYTAYLFKALALAQISVFDDPYGFVAIKSDSVNIPVYIDGDLIGHTPINEAIPLIAGSHYIDIKPLSISNPFSQQGPINDSKHIYIFSDDTANVVLNPYKLQLRSERLVKEQLYTSYIGLGLGLLTIWQLWIITG